MKTFTKTFLFLCTFAPVSVVLASKSPKKLNSRAFYSNSPTSSLVKLTANLFYTPGDPSSYGDGNVVVFDSAYSDAVDGDDAMKLSNPGENFAIQRNGSVLAVEARQPVSNTDTIYYDMWHMRQQTYEMQFLPENLNNPGLSAYLIDNYLGTSTVISLSGSTSVPFTVTSVAGSYAANRFEVVFVNTFGPLPVTFTSVSTMLQSEYGIGVNWKVASETDVTQYAIERSTDGLNFAQLGSVSAKMNNGQTASYDWLDANPAAGTDYYRIKSIAKSGTVSYSAIVKETIGNTKASISVYPNPVAAGQINLVLSNQPSGTYKVRLLNMSGQEVYATSLNHNAGSTNEKLNIEGIISMGAYKLEALGPDKKVYTTGIFIK